MSRKAEMVYFDNFVACADCAVRAAGVLESVLENFDPDNLSVKIDEMHEVEHEADVKKHEMIEELMKAFITPIEREDIMAMSQYLDDITDKIEDVVLHMYMCNVKSIRPEAVRFAKLVIRSCEQVKVAMIEFPEFKKSKELRQTLIEINRLEEQGDRMYLDSMRTLHTHTDDPIEVIVWRDIFKYLEDCIDACEKASDIVETVIMKNS